MSITATDASRHFAVNRTADCSPLHVSIPYDIEDIPFFPVVRLEAKGRDKRKSEVDC